jgi:hypothetical protein
MQEGLRGGARHLVRAASSRRLPSWESLPLGWPLNEAPLPVPAERLPCQARKGEGGSRQ